MKSALWFFTNRLLFFLVVIVICTYIWIRFTTPKEEVAQVNPPLLAKSVEMPQKEAPIQTQSVLAAVAQPLPDSFVIKVITRKQKFNLSCEFAAAATIIYHYTFNNQFSPENETQAEKLLVSKVNISQNPNIGLRIGVVQSKEDIFKNLDQKGGGTDYYGIHAPPFIDVFDSYQLQANTLPKETALKSIKESLVKGHLVMAWIRTGYGRPIDVSLSYGTTTLIKGEHVIVVDGYDKDHILAMDPGTGVQRAVPTEDFLAAISLYHVPLLEVYKGSAGSVASSEFSLATPIDSNTGLDRSSVTVLVENGSGEFLKGSEMVNVLRDFGYHVLEIRNASSDEYQGASVRLKNDKKDYVGLLKRDLLLGQYKIATISADLPANFETDADIIIGQ